MAIVVAYGDRPDIPPLCMSNGLAAVFVSVMAISASMQATTDRERRLAVWLASHDQVVYGRGVVDFDLAEIPWAMETFESDKHFLQLAAGAALSKRGWDRLDYNPREESVCACLKQFLGMLGEFSSEHVNPPEEFVWAFGEDPDRFEPCSKHGVYLHSKGCVVCNDD